MKKINTKEIYFRRNKFNNNKNKMKKSNIYREKNVITFLSSIFKSQDSRIRFNLRLRRQVKRGSKSRIKKEKIE